MYFTVLCNFRSYFTWWLNVKWEVKKKKRSTTLAHRFCVCHLMMPHKLFIWRCKHFLSVCSSIHSEYTVCSTRLSCSSQTHFVRLCEQYVCVCVSVCVCMCELDAREREVFVLAYLADAYQKWAGHVHSKLCIGILMIMIFQATSDKR